MITVRRGGKTAREWTGLGEFVDIGPRKGNLRLLVSIPVTKGNSDVEVTFEPSTFDRLALAMLRSDQDAAIKAFGAALQQLEAREIIEGSSEHASAT